MPDYGIVSLQHMKPGTNRYMAEAAVIYDGLTMENDF